MKASKSQIQDRMYNFRQAINAVSDRINPQTLGPCHYCEWPITRCFQGRNLVATCSLCLKFTDTMLTRRWEDEEPACAI